jgi:hypothetical protein
MNLAGPHGGGYLLLALMLFGLPVSAFILYLAASGLMAVWGFSQMGWL